MKSIEAPILTTSRLILRSLEIADAVAVQELFPRSDIVKFMSNRVPWPYPTDGALTFIRDLALPAMRQGQEWHWSIRRKSAPSNLIGVISLMTWKDENRGFWLDPVWQGQGFMAEASAAVTDYWFDVLGRDVLRVSKAAANTRSRRVSERSGMRLIRTEEREYVCGRLPAEIWEITRDEWHNRTR